MKAIRKNKMGNIKVERDGYKFDSKKERDRYIHLNNLQEAGVISGLEMQKTYVLAPSVLLDGRRKPALRYVADFFYFNRDINNYVVEDVKPCKSLVTPVYRIKKHLMKHIHGIDIIEIY